MKRLFWVGANSVFSSKSTEYLLTGFPYVATMGNCFLWTIYSFSNVTDLLFNIVLNIAGLLLNLSFSGLFFVYSPWSKRQPFLIQLAGVIAMCITGIVLSATVGAVPVGFLAGAVNVLMYGAFAVLPRMRARTRTRR